MRDANYYAAFRRKTCKILHKMPSNRARISSQSSAKSPKNAPKTSNRLSRILQNERSNSNSISPKTTNPAQLGGIFQFFQIPLPHNARGAGVSKPAPSMIYPWQYGMQRATKSPSPATTSLPSESPLSHRECNNSRHRY